MGGSNCSFSLDLHRSVPRLCTLFSTTKPDTGEPTLHLNKQFCWARPPLTGRHVDTVLDDHPFSEEGRWPCFTIGLDSF